jgi:hypothetical protein
MEEDGPSSSQPAPASPAAGGGGNKGQKFRARKAREAASKASTLASGGSANGAAERQAEAGSSSAVQTATSDLPAALKVPDAAPSKE